MRAESGFVVRASYSCHCLPEPFDENGEIVALRDSECSVERLPSKRRTADIANLCVKNGAKHSNRSPDRSVREITGLQTLGHATVRRETIASGEETVLSDTFTMVPRHF